MPVGVAIAASTGAVVATELAQQNRNNRNSLDLNIEIEKCKTLNSNSEINSCLIQAQNNYHELLAKQNHEDNVDLGIILSVVIGLFVLFLMWAFWHG